MTEEEILAVISELPCVGAGDAEDCVVRPVQRHHVKTRGAGGKDWGNVVPLCWRCHHDVHWLGRRTWEARTGVDLADWARKIWERLAALGTEER